nr:40S ribosomal protein S24-1-like [Aegilops tauschii subsp. strangulata]
MDLKLFAHFLSFLSSAELKEWLAKVYEVKDPNCIFLFKFHTHFGGGKSSGFGLIYNNLESAKKFEPNYTRTPEEDAERRHHHKEKRRALAKKTPSGVACCNGSENSMPNHT